MLISSWYRCIYFAIIMLSICLYDASLAFLAKSSDCLINIFLVLALAFLVIDILLQTIAHKTYLLAFPFFTDLFSAVSLFIEIIFFWNLGNSTAVDLRKKNYCSKIIQPNNYSNPTKKMVKKTMIRKVLRRENNVCFYNYNTKPEPNNKVQNTENSGKISTKLVDNISRHVLIVLLLIIMITSILTTLQLQSYSVFDYAVEELEVQYENILVFFPLLCFIFLKRIIVWIELKTLKVGMITYAQESTRKLRATEILQWESSNVSIEISIKKDTQLEHAMSFGFSIIMILVFSMLFTRINRTIQNLIMSPLEKMVRLIEELTQHLCLLGENKEEQKFLYTNLFETEVIERTIETLSKIFASILSSKDQFDDIKIQDDISDTNPRKISAYEPLDDNTKHAQALALIAQKRKTSTQSRESIIRFNVRQENVIEARIQEQISVLENSSDLTSFQIKLEHFPELKNIEVSWIIKIFESSIILNATLAHSVATEYFKLFCRQQMAEEAYHFVKGVNKYREHVKQHFEKILKTYIFDNSYSCIGVSQREQNELRKHLSDMSIYANSFDALTMDALNVLHSQVFGSFLKSKYALAYIISQPQNRKRFSHLFLLKELLQFLLYYFLFYKEIDYKKLINKIEMIFLDTSERTQDSFCNDKGFMEFSDQLVIDKRYKLQKPKGVDELELDHGKGRYGSVYCAYDTEEKNYKAIKILKLPEKDGDDVTNDNSNFNHLGEKDNPKINCPFVIELLGYGWYKRHCYFVFNYFEVTLQQHLDYILQLNLESVEKLKQLNKKNNHRNTNNNNNSRNHSNNNKSSHYNFQKMEKLIHIYKNVVMHPFDVWIVFFQLLHALACSVSLYTKKKKKVYVFIIFTRFCPVKKKKKGGTFREGGGREKKSVIQVKASPTSPPPFLPLLSFILLK
ncbi:hypothetical protein RFI_35292 [Reticulomyxa filosa]|uniref:RGS domain-containing protein n=1 Tax=Reticulomyxa filosa TaxID=46433 RepID=X6LL87_RETFI|nr:hypothetical protein RFI_35292 [Reticulomyxa filosa]|eukprot:ETO02146.1 hypothetical protein RFI_35292 [Reticulomyxa filosa]